MILAVDVRYRGDRAVAAYDPGQFYKRELPCILALVEQLERPPECIIVDGYVHLGRARRPGLSQHLYDALAGHSAVIGVAKSRYRDTPNEARLSVRHFGRHQPGRVERTGRADVR